MKKLTKKQLEYIENWIYENARPIEVAKWNFIWGKGTSSEILNEMLKYQNIDGGFGNGFEPDILPPQSSAIASAEAIFIVFDFDIDVSREWFQKLLQYFVHIKQDTPSYWEKVTRDIENYPRPPWWNYGPDTKFTPNPCAVVGAALLLYGNGEQKALGNEIAKKCIAALKNNETMSEHDIYCLQRLFIALQKIHSELMDEKGVKALESQILNRVSCNPDEWMNYVAQPLDLVDSPNSPWHRLIEKSIPKNVNFWLDNLNDEGVWSPNFSWGTDSTEAKEATKQWMGYIAVKRVKILKNFGLVETL